MSQSINEDKKYISEIRDSSGNEYKIINNRIEAPTYVSGTFYRPGDQVYKDDVLYTYVGYDSINVYDNSFSYKFEKANFAKRSGTLKAVGKITYKTDNARYLKIYENISDGYYSYFDSSYFKKLKQGDLIVVRFQEDTVIPASTKVIEIINAQENGSYCFSADISWPGVSYHYKSKQDYIIPANEAAIFRLTSFGINNGKDQYTLNDCLYIGSTTDVHNYHDPSKQDKEEGKGLSTNDFTNEYKSKVDGAQIALSKESYKVLIDEFNAMEEAKGLLVGQNIYIQTIEVPDLWISSIEQTKQTYTYTTDQALINAIKLNGNQQIGFYKLSILETAKVDLSGYYTKTETDGLVGAKQNTLVSGTNIKTINSQSILGEGNIEISGNHIDAPEFVSGTMYRSGDLIYKNNELYIYNGYGESTVYDSNFSVKFKKFDGSAIPSSALIAFGKTYITSGNSQEKLKLVNMSAGYEQAFSADTFKKLRAGQLILVTFGEEKTFVNESYHYFALTSYSDYDDTPNIWWECEIDFPGSDDCYKNRPYKDIVVPDHEYAIFEVVDNGAWNSDTNYKAKCRYIGCTSEGIDLSGYYTKTETDTLLIAKINEPSSEGTNGQVLTTDGNGGRTWTNVSGGTQIQYDSQTGNYYFEVEVND